MVLLCARSRCCPLWKPHQRKVPNIVPCMECYRWVDTRVTIAKIAKQQRGSENGQSPERRVRPEMPEDKHQRGEGIGCGDGTPRVTAPGWLAEYSLQETAEEQFLAERLPETEGKKRPRHDMLERTRPLRRLIP